MHMNAHNIHVHTYIEKVTKKSTRSSGYGMILNLQDRSTPLLSGFSFWIETSYSKKWCQDNTH